MTHPVPVYAVTFIKKDGSTRHMKFCYLSDMPEQFLKDRVKGGNSPDLGADMFRVWDTEADGFRILTRSAITVPPVPTGTTYAAEVTDPA